MACTSPKPVMTLTLDTIATRRKGIENGATSSSTQENGESENTHDESCGCGVCKPQCLKNCARPMAYLFCISWLVFAQSLLVSGYISSIVTTLERRYDLQSSQVGFMISSYDIIATFTVLLVSYFGDRYNRARCLGFGALLIALGALVFSLPQWFGERYQKYKIHRDGELASNRSVLHDVNICKHTDAFADESLWCDSAPPQVWALGVFISAKLIIGLGASPVYTLGPTYLYDNVRPNTYSIYAGIMYSMGALGPAVGFLMGGAFTSIYVEPWLQPAGSSERDAEWVGMWWMGMLVCAVLALISAVPLMMFPKQLPGIVHGETDTRQTNVEEPTLPGYGKDLKDLPKQVCSILCTPTFVCVTMVMVVEQSISTGFIAFIAKYIQVSFNIPASKANILTGAVIIPAAFLGIIMGGILVRRLQLDLPGLAKLVIVLSAVPTIGITTLLFLGCKNVDLAGITTQYGYISLPEQDKGPPDMLDIYRIHYKDNLTDSCNANCRCSSSTYQPVCGGDDITYFSPCHAGCTKLHVYDTEEGYTVRNYSSCACIYEDFVHQTAIATTGKCDPGCFNMYPSLVILFIVVFLICCGQNPVLILTLRSVGAEQRSFALGIQNVISRLLALIPAPIYFGRIFDVNCILWSETCDGKGACLEYNIEDLPFMFFGVCLILKSFAYVFFILMFFAAKNAAKKEEKESSVSPPVGAHNCYENKIELDTPQSDITVATICSNYSLYTESTKL